MTEASADWIGTVPAYNAESHYGESHLPSLHQAEVSELKELVDHLGDAPEKRRHPFGDANRWGKLPDLMESARDGWQAQASKAGKNPGPSMRWKATINLTKAVRKGGTLRGMVAQTNSVKVAEFAKEAEKRSAEMKADMLGSETSPASGLPRPKTGPMAGQRKANQKPAQSQLQSLVMRLVGPNNKSDMNSTQSSFGASASSLSDLVPSTPGTAPAEEEDLAAKPQFPSPSARKMANILQRVRERKEAEASQFVQVPQTAPDLSGRRRRSLLDVGRPTGSRWNQTWTGTQEETFGAASPERNDPKSASQEPKPNLWRMDDVPLPASPRSTLPALKDSSGWMKLNKRVRDAIVGQSEGLVRESAAAARRASLGREEAEPDLGLLEVRRPSQMHRDSIVASSGASGPSLPSSPRGVLAAPPPAAPQPPSVALLASALVDHFGSLIRAYDHFDFSHKGRFSRAQFYAGCASVRLNFRTLSGLTVREIFRRMDDANLEDHPQAERVAPRGEVCRMKWMKFFEAELQESETSELLTADKGSEVERRLEERRKERNLKKVGEEPSPTSPTSQPAPAVEVAAEVGLCLKSLP